MADTQIRPDLYTTEEVAELRRALADAELRAMKAAAAEDVAQFSFETARRRADTAEAHLIAVLAELVVDSDLPEEAAASIAESIRQDLDGGLAVDEVPEQAHRLAADWAEAN